MKVPGPDFFVFNVVFNNFHCEKKAKNGRPAQPAGPAGLAARPGPAWPAWLVVVVVVVVDVVVGGISKPYFTLFHLISPYFFHESIP